jgi:membrane protein DedA with SNARE-associated domain/membrane-associated phospholipid phosphatase
MHSFLSMVGSHPQAALLAVFLVACAESLAIVGALVPAAVVMFGAGALIGTGTLELWITLATAVCGAAIGDGLSYELGRARETRIRAWPLFRGYSQALARGEAFLARHGGASILLARFAAPVRAFVPLLAGFGHMPRSRFYAVNILSALMWAPVHILPGVLFGASLQVAEAVSGRLAVIVLLLVLMGWFFVWLVTGFIRFAMPGVQHLRDVAVARARGRSTPLARGTLALLDPARPGSHALLLGAVLLLAAGWLFLGVLEDVLSHDPLVQVDLAVFHLLQNLRTASVDRLMIVFTEMGSVGVLLPLAIAVALWLLWSRSWRTAAYWIGVTAFSEVLVQLLKFTLGRRRPLDLYTGVEQFSFPSGHAVVSTVMLGFLAFLLARRQTMSTRLAIGTMVGLYVTLVAFSRLYLGAHWLSDVIGGISLGVAWIAVVAVVYTQRGVDENFRLRGLMLVVAVSLLAFGGWWVNMNSATDLLRYAPADQRHVISQQEWLDQGWRRLPDRRLEAAGDPEEPFGLQWACGEADISTRLDHSGWRLASTWSLQSALAWLVPHAQLADLPVLPRFDRGNRSELAFVRWNAARPDEREVLRLWRSDLQVHAVGAAASKLPVWYGAVYRETRPQHLSFQSLGARRVIVSPITFAAELPGDVRRQEQLRDPGKAPTVLALCS